VVTIRKVLALLVLQLVVVVVVGPMVHELLHRDQAGHQGLG